MVVKNLCPVLKGLVGGKGTKTLDSQLQVEDDFGESISINHTCLHVVSRS